MAKTTLSWAMAVGAVAIAGTLPGGPARADDWDDPAADSLARLVRRMESARGRGGEENAQAAVVARKDEVVVFADLARVDVTLDVANRGTGNEWRRFLVVEPEADLIAATYVRADGLETSARTLTAEDSRRLYGRATNPNYGRDPLVIEREARERRDVSVFPLAAGQSARLLLSFVTPLHGPGGRGADRTYRDPLAVRAVGGAGVTTPPERSRRRDRAGGGVPVSSGGVPTAAVSGTAFRLLGVLPGVLPEGTGLARGEDGSLVVSAPGGEPVTELPLRAVRSATPAVTIRAGGFALYTSAFAWRVDPDEQLRALGVEPRRDFTLRIKGLSASTGRIAPDVLAASAEPTVVMGRAANTGSIRLVLEALDGSGKVVARGEASPESGRASPGEPMEDAMRAYHRARLVDRVYRWAGDDPKKIAEARAYAVDLGVVGRGVGAIAVPKDERGFLSRRDVRLYLTDGAPIGADDSDARRDGTSAPTGSVR